LAEKKRAQAGEGTEGWERPPALRGRGEKRAVREPPLRRGREKRAAHGRAPLQGGERGQTKRGEKIVMLWELIEAVLFADEWPEEIPFAPVRLCAEPCTCGCGGAVPVIVIVGLN
jgi:hypothetical protein